LEQIVVEREESFWEDSLCIEFVQWMSFDKIEIELFDFIVEVDCFKSVDSADYPIWCCFDWVKELLDKGHSFMFKDDWVDLDL
jgi:hypothetical protein